MNNKYTVKHFTFLNNFIFSQFCLVLLILLSVRFSMGHAALTCHELFNQNANQFPSYDLHTSLQQFETSYLLPNATPDTTQIKSKPIITRFNAQQKLNQIFKTRQLPFVFQNMRIVVNLSPSNSLHIITEGISLSSHQLLVEFFKQNKIDLMLQDINIYFRNKYFEIQISIDSLGSKNIIIEDKFDFDIQGLNFRSQLLSGFGTAKSQHINPYKDKKRRDHHTVRHDLMTQKTSQDNLATCGPHSIEKILKARGIDINESDIFDLIIRLGIKTESDYFGETPGLTLTELSILLKTLGQQYGFSAEVHLLETLNDESEFKKYSILASHFDNKTDIIINYYSPNIGRHGAGHFSVVAGYNSKNNSILVSEVNLARNPSFWVKLTSLYGAMANVDNISQHPRGYIIIRWP